MTYDITQHSLFAPYFSVSLFNENQGWEVTFTGHHVPGGLAFIVFKSPRNPFQLASGWGISETFPPNKL